MFYHKAEIYAEYTTSNRQSDSVGILSGTPRDATTFPDVQPPGACFDMDEVPGPCRCQVLLEITTYDRLNRRRQCLPGDPHRHHSL
jgi:hypothetical protein